MYAFYYNFISPKDLEDKKFLYIIVAQYWHEKSGQKEIRYVLHLTWIRRTVGWLWSEWEGRQ